MNLRFETDTLTTSTIGGVAPLGGDWIRMNDIINDWVCANGNPLCRKHWEVADILLHEFGHTRRLRHTHDCSNICDDMGFDVDMECFGMCQGLNPSQGVSFINSGPEKLIMGSYFDPTHFVECEFGEMWNYMINNQSDYQIIETCELPPNNEKIIYDENASIVWDSKKIFTKHVVIKSGTTISVNCEVQMGDDKEIVVEEGAKLIVDGGTITSICEKPWRGIKAYGGDDTFIVEIKNASTINNTSQGAVSMFHDGGWLLGSGNAHVLIQGSTFNDCNRILGMGTTLGAINLSRIKGNIQNGGKHGVTNWNCLNVTITDNNFDDISESCIVSSGQIFLRDNEFRSRVNDVLFPSTNPSIASIIENNDFFGQGVGLRMQGAGVAPHQIINNRFHSNNQTNIRMEGDNHFLIENNEFDGFLGGTFIENSDHFNVVNANNVNTNIYGFRVAGLNSGWVINNNCYETSSFDNYITGEIGSVQGSVSGNFGALLPANNCFTHQGSISSPVEDLFGTTNNFVYIEPDDDVDECRDAVKAEPNIVIDEIGDTPISICLDDDEGETDDPCNPIKEIESVNQAIFQLEAILENLDDSNAAFDIYTRCYESVRGIWIELMFEDQNFEEVRSYLSTSDIETSHLLVYKSYLLENDFEAAKQHLLSLSTESEQLNDFKTLQLVELKRLSSNLEYEVTEEELGNILHIAQKENSYAAYGKSLYYWITGDLLSTYLPPVEGENETHERSKNQTENSKSNVEVFPNPFSKSLNIVTQNSEEVNLKFVINNILGRRIYQQNVFIDKENIDTSLWENGVYFLRIYEGEELITTKKIILSK